MNQLKQAFKTLFGNKKRKLERFQTVMAVEIPKDTWNFRAKTKRNIAYSESKRLTNRKPE